MSRENEPQKQKILVPTLLITIGLVLIVGSIAWAAYEKSIETTSGINSFQACKGAGGRIAESYPEQCFIDDKSFANPDQKTGDESGYIGLTEDEALEKASRDNQTIRVVERDGESLPVTMDFMDGRHNISIKDGRVYKIHIETIDQQ
jgi:hypothetical protein